MYKSYIPYLQHFLDECFYLRSVITDEMEIETFLRGNKLLYRLGCRQEYHSNINSANSGSSRFI